jgi:hypothetical protein
MDTNDFESQIELSNAVFGLATRNLVDVCEYGRSFGDAMAIARHGLLLLGFQPGI